MRKQGDPARALQQQAYMKSEMAYYGLSASEMRAICREAFREYAFDDGDAWQNDVLALWRNAVKREERYAAVELAQHRKAKALHHFKMLPMLEEMIVSGAWWDYVDALASHNLTWILEREDDRKKMKKEMLKWSVDDDMWKRRSSIICQLHTETTIDLELLYKCIEPSLSSKEFFLRKAIGWALRQHAWSDPKEVIRYVTKNVDRLSPLSIREALKNVDVPATLKKAITSSQARAKKQKTS